MFATRSLSDLFCQPLEDRTLFAIQAFLTLVPTGPAGKPAAPIVFEVKSYKFGVTVPVISSPTGGAGAGRATFKQLEVTKLMDALDPTIFTAVINGRVFTSARLNVMEVSLTKKVKMVEYKFSTVAISGMEISAPDASVEPTNEIDVAYGNATINVKQPAAAKAFRKARRAFRLAA